jgi:hypothetical protein
VQAAVLAKTSRLSSDHHSPAIGETDWRSARKQHDLDCINPLLD